MKIEMIAIAPREGWGFITMDSKKFILRPPYVASSVIEVSNEIVQSALKNYGFEVCSITFNSISQTIKFLKEKYIKARKDEGVSLPTPEQLNELLKYAPENILMSYLNKANSDLIPKGHFYAAETIALELMKLEKVKNNPKIVEICTQILKNCSKERQKMNKLAEEVSNELHKTWPVKFPSLTKVYAIESLIHAQKLVSNRRQLLCIENSEI